MPARNLSEFPIPTDQRMYDVLKRVLDEHPDIDTAHIRFDIHNGHVTLHGATDCFWKRSAIEHLALLTEGVRDVDNQLAVVPLPNDTDEALAERIVAAIVREAEYAADGLHVKVSGGVVTLTGVAPTAFARDALATPLERLSGVVSVRNFVDIAPPAPAGSV
jgi:osmotically-inducible protein OsmY